jgi:hypothetical protein
MAVDGGEHLRVVAHVRGWWQMAKGGGERPTVVAKGEGGDELLRVVANGQRWWRRARVVAKGKSGGKRQTDAGNG